MEPCKFFNTPMGCRNGANCGFAHAFSMKPPCRFFGSEQGCRFGDGCMYSHDTENSPSRGMPFGRPRGRGRGRGGRGSRQFMSRGAAASSTQSFQDRQWYRDESDEENAPPAAPPAVAAPKYKPDRLNELLSYGLKPTPEGWEEYNEIQRAFREADQDVEMQDDTTQENFGAANSVQGFQGHIARGRGRVFPHMQAHPSENGVFHHGRGGRGIGGLQMMQ